MTTAEHRIRSQPRTFDSVNPATGDVVGTHPVDGPEQVGGAVARARPAAQWWAELGFDERRRRLKAWKGIVARRAGELAELIHRENGKPTVDAFIEIMVSVDLIEWASRKAKKVLGPRRMPAGLTMINHAASLEYQPLGVIGVIGPWNYPLVTPMGSLASALAAGNAVVFKPSEFTPGVGLWLAKHFDSVVPEHPVFQVVTGYGETGAALCASGVDKIAFTGSARTGRKVMAACATNLTPVLMECGGKDAMIVAEDADVDAAADAAVWGGMSNAGQTCIGVERIYVAEPVYDEFVGRVTEMARELTPGSHPEAHYGPITMPGQINVISRHLNDALDRGARALVGGAGSVHPPYVDPVVLVDVPAEAPAMCEETFGPTLAITRVRDHEEALRLANETAYGLAASVFSRRHGMGVARRLRTGMTSVNSVLSFSAVPSLPFGGVGESGFGRVHGEDGLREFSRAKAITRQRFRPAVNATTFAKRSDRTAAVMARLLHLVHGRR
ncbi:MAG: aldehyde dehydrogenase family protein [Nitriliruptorales bacterium]|nr:aldehyde dehydrogenase family protein [Nitriliruptorales bacterium]